MSEFYKEIRDRILNRYELLGIKDRLGYYGWNFCVILIIAELLKKLDHFNIDWKLIVLVIILLICYVFGQLHKKKYKNKRKEVVTEFMQMPDISLKVINMLIDEIEKYNKKVKTFAAWFTGLVTTVLILLLTIGSNYGLKLFDTYMKVTADNDLIEVLKDISWQVGNGSFISGIVVMGGQILFLLAMVIVIIYRVLCIWTFVKDQIRIFLLDVKYEMEIQCTQGEG